MVGYCVGVEVVVGEGVIVSGGDMDGGSDRVFGSVGERDRRRE